MKRLLSALLAMLMLLTILPMGVVAQEEETQPASDPAAIVEAEGQESVPEEPAAVQEEEPQGEVTEGQEPGLETPPQEEEAPLQDAEEPLETEEEQQEEPVMELEEEEPALEGSCGSGLTWHYNGAGTLTIAGSGMMDNFASPEEAPWAPYRGEITSLVLPVGLNVVGSNAFKQCTALHSITVSGGTMFGQDCFTGCDAISTITIIGNDFVSGSRVNTPWCTAVNPFKVVIAGSITAIPEGTFANCTALSAIDLGSVTNIGSKAFQNCTALQSLTIPASVLDVAEDAFLGCSIETLTLPEQMVNAFTFRGFGNLENTKKLVLTGSGPMQDWGDTSPWAEVIGSGISVEIGEGITSVGSNWFRNASAVRSISLPSTITSIGNTAFYHCSNLVAINLPLSLTTIGDKAFANCASLESVVVPDGVQSLSGYLFAGCSSLRAVTLPASITAIPDYAFQGCSELRQLPLHAGVTSVGQGAFQGCTALTEVSLPNGVKTVAEYAFSGCSNVSSVRLPASLEVLGGACFDGCPNLATVVYLGTPEQGEELKIGEILPSDADLNVHVHAYAVTEKVEAACTTAGSVTYFCSQDGCNSTYQEEIPIKGHIIVEDEAVAATCMQDGLTAGSHCATCDEVLLVQETVAAFGHTPETVSAVAPDYVHYGKGEWTRCSTCGETLVDAETVPPVSMELTLAKATNTTTVKITWKKLTGITGYQVYRFAKGEARPADFATATPYKTIPSAKTVTMTDKVQPGTVYEYFVCPYKLESEAVLLGTPVSTGTICVPLAKPSLSIRRVAGELVVTWKHVTGAVQEQYRVYVDRGMGEEQENVSIAPQLTKPAIMECHIPASALAACNIRVEAVSLDDVVTSSAVKLAKGNLKTPALTVKAASDLHSLTISWKPVIGATAYRLYLDDAEYTYTAAPEAPLTFTCLPVNHTVRLVAMADADANGPVCAAPATKTAKMALKTPSVTKVVMYGSVPGNSISYMVYSSTVMGACGAQYEYHCGNPEEARVINWDWCDHVDPVTGKTIGANFGFPQLRLNRGKTYYFRVRASYRDEMGNIVYSAWSKYKTVKLSLKTPAVGTPYQLKDYKGNPTNGIGIVATADDFTSTIEVYRSTSPKGEFELVGTIGKTYTNQFIMRDSNLTKGVTYYYKFRAVHEYNNTASFGPGYSGFSTVKSFTLK